MKNISVASWRLSDKRSFGIIPLRIFVKTIVEFKPYFKTELARCLRCIAVLENDDKVVGYCCSSNIKVSLDPFNRLLHTIHDDECYIEMMSVLNECRGQGVVTRLLEFAEDLANLDHAKKLSLDVVANN